MRNSALTAPSTAPERRSREDLAKIAISVIVTTILAAQVLIGFSYRGGQTFPMLAYPMYMRAHYEGERLNDYLGFVSADGGEEKALGPEALELSPLLYQKTIAAPIINGKPSPLAAKIAQATCQAGGARGITISIYDSGYTIRRDGPVRDARKLMGSTTFDCSAF
ncbi:hypothetical protein [Amaricoccus sp.]|uniref:hypothetical protein n=1 Tax=Amaricoccus sp. TaxID=1872485 RepID=UPI0026361B71|nr:hypothetical protein [Amaricoccus sp.]HRO13039.1 hypothetical protein [Amaricoccus sp.]